MVGVFEVLKEYRQYISLALVIIGFISTVIWYTEKQEDIKDESKLVQIWFEQLPQNHWIKSNDYLCEKDLMSIMDTSQVYGSGIMDISIKSLSDEMPYKMGKILQVQYNKQKREEQKKYMLIEVKNSKEILPKNKNFTFDKIQLDIGEEKQLMFLYDDQKLLFDCSKEQFYDTENRILKYLVFSYIRNPNIAIIYNGKITGISKGETELVIGRGKNQFRYKVLVK